MWCCTGGARHAGDEGDGGLSKPVLRGRRTLKTRGHAARPECCRYDVRMALTGNQKRQLRTLGQKKADDTRLGKAGLSEGFVENLRRLLAEKELVKVRFTEVEGGERKALAKTVADAADAELITLVGRTALLYRANPELDAASRALPA